MENDRIYLCDFGFTAFFGNDEQWISMCGTWDYLAPEIAMKKPQNEKVDIWCVGILIYELINKKVPFSMKDIYLMEIKG